jgi:hypothetical protein
LFLIFKSVLHTHHIRKAWKQTVEWSSNSIILSVH